VPPSAGEALHFKYFFAFGPKTFFCYIFFGKKTNVAFCFWLADFILKIDFILTLTYCKKD